MKGIISKCTVLKADLLQDHQIHCFEEYMCALFSPENFEGYGSEGVKKRRKRMILVIIVQELGESRGGRPGLSVLMNLLVSVDVKL